MVRRGRRVIEWHRIAAAAPSWVGQGVVSDLRVRGKLAAFTHSEPRRPRAVWTMSLDTGQLAELTDGMAHVDAGTLVDPRARHDAAPQQRHLHVARCVGVSAATHRPRARRPRAPRRPRRRMAPALRPVRAVPRPPRLRRRPAEHPPGSTRPRPRLRQPRRQRRAPDGRSRSETSAPPSTGSARSPTSTPTASSSWARRTAASSRSRR